MKKGQKIIAMVSMVLVLGLIIFAGCSKSNTDLQTLPKSDNGKAVLITSNEATPVDCLDWTWEQLNEWGQNIAKDLTCTEINERLREDKCFRKWFNEWVDKQIEAGNMELTSSQTFYADENEKGPNCGVVDEGNENCFNGDFEKLDAWVHKIIERENEKEIMNKVNHNPCFREWMSKMGLLDQSHFDKQIIEYKTESYSSHNCLSRDCVTCSYSETTIYFDDGTYSHTKTYKCTSFIGEE